MGDSICKWRTATVPTVVELVHEMPKSILPKDDFLDRMDKSIFGKGFRKTAYQLACQLGLYYINDKNEFIPRFCRDISEDEARAYMEWWVYHYVVPNPYTRSFNDNVEPKLFVETLAMYLNEHKGAHPFDEVLKNIYGETVGNISPTKYFLSEYTNLFVFDKFDNISLNPNFNIDMLSIEDRNNKDAFFHQFDETKPVLSIPNIEELGALQLIYFGAPGTGKSHKIKKVCSLFEHYRITFHPDTDYASFVGSYKPITISEQVYTNMGEKAIPLKDSVSGDPVLSTKITYQYVYQAFLNAYLAAWREQKNEKPKPVFLVIEEINRGNCAQIFGDIFQLLDRNESGFSDYPIVADNDLRKELEHEFNNLEVANAATINEIYGDDIINKVKSGSCLLLPNNLYIWATMNTSDQSLFPIDSAFKRRWEWKYVKITDSGLNYRIAVNGNEYDWWEFVKAINAKIGSDTDQEDKKLGYFFAKAKKNADGNFVISADTLLSKVLFFIYNDVYKDFGLDDAIFQSEEGETMNFADYFNEHGDTVHDKVERFLLNLGLEPLAADEQAEEAQDEAEIEEDKNDDGSSNKLTIRFPDGTIVKEPTRFESFKKALEIIGLDKVEPIAAEKKYMRRNSALVSTSESPEILADPVYTYVKSGDYYIVKGTNTRTQRNLLNLISDRLNLGLKVTVE